MVDGSGGLVGKGILEHRISIIGKVTRERVPTFQKDGDQYLGQNRIRKIHPAAVHQQILTRTNDQHRHAYAVAAVTRVEAKDVEKSKL